MAPVYKSNYPEGTSTADVYADGIQGAFETQFASKLLATIFGGTWEKRERARAPYTDSWELADAGITLFASQTLVHCCVEISGAGCERLIKMGAVLEVLSAIHDRCTRIDIACDIETETSPLDFVSILSHERMRASGYQKSETGETCYVGSQKSDRYARVYRYAKPHPRAHLLRIEHVFRREYAKKVADAYSSASLESVAASCGEAFGWTHRDWKMDMDKLADITIISPARKGGATISWLIQACAPAFKRLVKEGVIRDPEEFIQQYFMSDEGINA